MILKLQRNTQGRDWAVGDIHGCFRQLSRLLKMAAFNPTCDRLFSVGDMVDRGADSAAVLEWLAQPWFHAVRGNHEQLAIDSLLGDKQAEIRHVNNGGSWLLALPTAQRLACLAAFQRLPYAIEIADGAGGRIGVVHADCPDNDWDALVAGLENGTLPDASRNTALWSRERAQWPRRRGQRRRAAAGWPHSADQRHPFRQCAEPGYRRGLWRQADLVLPE